MATDVTAGADRDAADELDIPRLRVGDVLEIIYETPSSGREFTRVGEVGTIQTTTDPRGPDGDVAIGVDQDYGGRLIIWPSWSEVWIDQQRLGTIVDVRHLGSA